MGAAFLSAGGYHHHIGMNTWHTLNEVHCDGETGLEDVTITIPDRSSFDTIKSIINRHASSEQQKQKKADNNQFLIFDPDDIQIVIK
jgi:catechol 2,3-dioxygenase